MKTDYLMTADFAYLSLEDRANALRDFNAQRDRRPHGTFYSLCAGRFLAVANDLGGFTFMCDHNQ